VKRKLIAVSAAATTVALLLAGCSSGGNSSSASSTPIVIGASLPLTGSLSGFGPVLKAGYQAAVDEVNKAGGITVDGTKRKVKLIILDSTSDPNTVTDQSKALVLQDNAVGFLGSISPALTIPASNVAEIEKVPIVSTLTPVESWKAGNKAGWHYAWDMFFDEKVQTNNPFKTADLTTTNKKVALFTDNEEDGIAMGALWEKNAPGQGFQIVSHAKFPVGTTDFSQFINAAKAADAQVVITQMIPPDAFALWKQMKALQFVPKVAFCEKCSSQASFQKALGPLAEGTSSDLVGSNPASPETAILTAEFQPTFGKTIDLDSVMAAYSAAKVLLDAITKAGNTNGAKVNAAIGKTSGEYPIGDVKFDSANAYAPTPVSFQWQGTSQLQVYPKSAATVPLKAPVTGLQ